MTNLNILQEINKQVNNFDPKEIYTGLQMIQKLMPTLVAREFNAMSGEWQKSIDRNRATTITQVAEDIQKCFNLNSKVTDLSTYGFIAHNAQAHQPRINSERSYDTYRDRNQQGRHEQHRTHTEAERRERTPRSFGERSRALTSPIERSNPRSPDHTHKYTQSSNRDREMSQTRGQSKSRNIQQRTRIEETASKPTKACTERQRSRSRDPSVPRETTFKHRRETTPRPTRTQSNA
jgi:hypothetical protein